MTYLDLDGFSDWMRPVLARLDTDSLERCDGWALALHDSAPDVGDLTLAAHGHFPGQLLADLETGIGAAAENYRPGGKKVLVSRLAGAVLIHRMSEDAGTGTTSSAHAALSVKSAAFVDMSPVIPALRRAADSCLDRTGRNRRARLAPTPSRAPRKQTRKQPAAGADDAAVTASMLRTELAKKDTTIAALNRRVDELAQHHQHQLTLLDEELDALWWWRSDESLTTGEKWASMNPLDRAVLTGHEVAHLVQRVPPTHAHEQLINSAVTDTHTTYGLEQIVQALARYPSVPRSDRGAVLRLRPLATAVEVTSRSGDGTDAIAGLRAVLGVNEHWRRNGPEIARQLLVERCLGMSAS